MVLPGPFFPGPNKEFTKDKMMGIYGICNQLSMIRFCVS